MCMYVTLLSQHFRRSAELSNYSPECSCAPATPRIYACQDFFDRGRIRLQFRQILSVYLRVYAFVDVRVNHSFFIHIGHIDVTVIANSVSFSFITRCIIKVLFLESMSAKTSRTL